jgi:ankyrin repeat protein
MIASMFGHTEVTKLLIEAGADVNAQDNKAWAALKYASKKGHTEIVNLLREAGAKD